jgi:hypothetical protein
VEHAGERVATQLVGAERMSPARRQQPVGCLVVWADPPDEAAEESREHVESDDRGADEADRVAPAAEEVEAPLRHLRPGGRRQDLADGALGGEHGSAPEGHASTILGSRKP